LSLTNKIYPITYVGGTLGSSLGWFLSLHDGFYTVSPEFELTQTGNIARHLEGIVRIPHTEELINETIKPFPNHLKVACSVEVWKRIPTCDYRLDHRCYPRDVWHLLGKDIFPIVVEPKEDIINFAKKRMGLEAMTTEHLSARLAEERYRKLNEIGLDDRQNLEGKQNPAVILKTIEQLKEMGDQDSDWLLIDILKLYRDRDESEYQKLCNFAGVNPRWDWEHTLKNLAQLVELDKFL